MAARRRRRRLAGVDSARASSVRLWIEETFLRLAQAREEGVGRPFELALEEAARDVVEGLESERKMGAIGVREVVRRELLALADVVADCDERSKPAGCSKCRSRSASIRYAVGRI